ncbi:MAG: hypothetical protein JWL72_3394 [Ilumatobacteraceae bacterium]|nr:hypothetical protein [Ilumatobacteraceae bacterium]
MAIGIGHLVRVTEVDFVIVSGPPGSGKSTLAEQLAAELRLPLLGKDIIKEAMMDALEVETVDDSRRLGAAAIAVLLALARANGRAVLESNWSAQRATHDLRSLGGIVVEVFCDVDPAVSRRRYLDRAATRHRGHFDLDRSDDSPLWQGEALQPIAGGWQVLRVDTSAPTDVVALARSVAVAAEHA